MYQIDVPSAAPSLPAPSQAGAAGYFTDGSLPGGVAPTIVPAEFLNMMMMEMLNTIVAAGITPSKASNTQLQLALKMLANSAVSSSLAAYYQDAGTVANAYYVRGLAASVDLVQNGMFSSDLSNWSITSAGASTVTWGTSGANLTGDGTNNAFLSQALATVPGQSYELDFTSGGFGVIAYAGTTQNSSNIFSSGTISAGVHTLGFTATGTTTWLTFARGSAGTVNIDNVSVLPALLQNGTFSNGTTGWTAGGGAALSVINGALRVTNDATGTDYGYASTSFATVPGRTYQAQFTKVGGSGAPAVNIGTSAGGNQIVAGAVTGPFTFVATTATTYLSLYLGSGANTYYDFDDVFVRQAPATPVSFRFRTTRANTGPASIDFGQGVFALKTEQGLDLVAGDLAVGSVTSVSYDPALGYVVVTEAVPSQTGSFRYIGATQLLGAGPYGTDTTAGPFTVTLPAAPATGTAISLSDLNGTWGSNNLTVAGNGNTIMGDSNPLICNVSGEDFRIWFNGSDWRLF